jgi:hypothetical protein
MPSRLGPIADRALQDGRIDTNEATELQAEAKADKKLTPEEKTELTGLLQRTVDQFEPAARAQLETFVNTTPTLRDLPDPSVLTKDATSLTYSAIEGSQLFVDGISYDDVVQGSIANCYMVGAFSALAYANPDTIKDAIKDNGDGTYTVRFFEQRQWGQPMVPVEVTVDGDVATMSAGGSSKYAKNRDQKEIWVPVLEKAYAQWKGGFEAIGNGGYAGEVMTALTGRQGNSSTISYSNPDQLFASIQANASTSHPMAAGTHGKDSGVDYNGTGVYAWHVYTVLGASEENGTKYVELRNPWGRTEPGSDGKDDGIFKMELTQFMKLYSSLFVN